MLGEQYGWAMAFGSLISALLVFLVAFLVLRTLMLWYWKVNRIVKLLEEQLEASKKTLGAIERLSCKIDLTAAPKIPTSPWEAENPTG